MLAPVLGMICINPIAPAVEPASSQETLLLHHAEQKQGIKASALRGRRIRSLISHNGRELK